MVKEEVLEKIEEQLVEVPIGVQKTREFRFKQIRKLRF